MRAECGQLNEQLGMHDGENGIIPCEGRLCNSLLLQDRKYPVFMPGRSKLAELFVKDDRSH